MSSLREKFDGYCHDENNRGCENCKYNDGHDTDIIGCAMNFAYQQGRADERKRFAEWCKTKGYSCYDWRMLFEQYEEEQRYE